MAVECKIFGTLRLASGLDTVLLDISENSVSIRSILMELGKLKGLVELKKLAQDSNGESLPFILLLQGKNVFDIDGLDTVVKDGQRVSIFPPSGGG